MSNNKHEDLTKKADVVQIEGPEPERLLTTSSSASSRTRRKVYRSRGPPSTRAVSVASIADAVEETTVQEPDELQISTGSSVWVGTGSTASIDSSVRSRSPKRSTPLGTVPASPSSRDNMFGGSAMGSSSSIASDSKLKLRSARSPRGTTRPGAVPVSPSTKSTEAPAMPRDELDNQLKLKLRSPRRPRTPTPGAYPVSPSMGGSIGELDPQLSLSTLEAAAGKVKLRPNRRAYTPGAVSVSGDGDDVSALMSSNASLSIHDLPASQEPHHMAGSAHSLGTRSMDGSASSLISLKSGKITSRRGQTPGAFHVDNMSASSIDAGRRNRLRPGAVSVSGSESPAASRKYGKPSSGLPLTRANMSQKDGIVPGSIESLEEDAMLNARAMRIRSRQNAASDASESSLGDSVMGDSAPDIKSRSGGWVSSVATTEEGGRTEEDELMEIVHELDTQDFIEKSAAMAPPRTGAFAIDGIAPSENSIIPSAHDDFETIPEELLGPSSSTYRTRQTSRRDDEATRTTEVPLNPLNAPVIPRDEWETERDEARRAAEIKEERTSSLNYRCLVVLLVVLAIGAIIGIVVGVLGGKDSSTPPPPTRGPTMSPSVAPSVNTIFCTQGDPIDDPRYAAVRDIVGQGSEVLLSSIDTPNSPQREAVCWIAFFDILNVETTEPDHLIQRYALAVLVYSFLDPETSDSRLLTNADSNKDWLGQSHECEWVDVYCDRANNVEVIDLLMSDSKARGTLPLEITILTSLRSFDVRVNYLSGSIPDFLWTMTLLKAIDLGENKFTGSVSESISALTNLALFFINDNRDLSGSIPLGLLSLPIINQIDLSQTGLTGTIPTEVGLLTGARAMAIEGTTVTGTVPTEIGLVQNMTEIRLGLNSFVDATLPTELGNLEELLDLDLSKGPFVGPIPTELGRLTKIVDSIRLSENSLTGAIPTELGLLVKANGLRFEHNEGLTGSMPPEICDLRSSGMLDILTVACENSDTPSVECDCCTSCPAVS